MRRRQPMKRRRLFRRRRPLLGKSYVRISKLAADEVNRVQAHKAAVQADQAEARHVHIIPDHQSQFFVLVNARPTLIVPAGRAVTIHAATVKEVCDFPRVDAREATSDVQDTRGGR
jgi:hypothetical protein